jgi:aminocarboxymuconate-semialdehyde decarboxylase
MRTIDIHAHVVPRSLWNAAERGAEWHGYQHESGDGAGTVVSGGVRTGLSSPKLRYTPEERMKDMDALGTDVQVLSIHTPLMGYHLDASQGRALARDFNEEVAAVAREYPKRFAGLATLPVQDVKSAIEELEHAVTRLGLKGAELDTNVNGEQWDEAKFLPFFKAAEQMGAVLFFHPQPQNNFLVKRNPRHGLSNSLGVILDDAIVAATLICGGVLEACPDLRVCIAHGGGPTCYAMGRLDRGWERLPKEKRTPQPPSVYQKRLYYDTVTSSEEALRFLLDTVGAERVVLGSDYDQDMSYERPVDFVETIPGLSPRERSLILKDNAARLLNL